MSDGLRLRVSIYIYIYMNMLANTSLSSPQIARRALLLVPYEPLNRGRDRQSGEDSEFRGGDLTTPQQPTVNSVIKIDYC